MCEKNGSVCVSLCVKKERVDKREGVNSRRKREKRRGERKSG